MELERSSGALKLAPDRRPIIPEPPPVRIVSVEDVHLPAAAGNEVELDEFYVGLLKFERDTGVEPTIVYRAENFRVWFDVQEPPVQREDFRPLMIEVPVLREIEKQLIEREVEYERQRGLHAGQVQLVLLDPAGNWISLGELREIR